jgi:Predicted ATP-dependent serine protease
MVPRSALDVLVDLSDNLASGKFSEYQPVPLGFGLLDKTIGGGLRAGELMLIGGAQGTGKTTMALQMARNVAAARPTSCTSASSTRSSTCSTGSSPSSRPWSTSLRRPAPSRSRTFARKS